MVNEKIPVNIITGFLGSGKTTAIIKLLNNKPSTDHWAVIINEFGKVSIDSQTLRSSADSGNIYEVSGGCICCSAKGYFRENLEQIIAIGSFSRIIIEPSGLGGIDMVSEIVLTMSNLKLLQIICLVDIFGLELEKLQRLPIYRNQILKADVIVFTKCDLLTEKTTENRLVEKFKSLFPGKRSFINRGDEFFWTTLFDSDDCSFTEENNFRMISAADTQLTDSNFHAFSYYFDAATIFSKDKLINVFKDHPEILRAKGHIHTVEGWKLLNFTLSGSLFEPSPGKGQSELILITERLQSNPEQNLELEINSAIVEPQKSAE